MLFWRLLTWSLRVHCSVQMSVMRFLACLAISSRNMLHSDRLRSPMWWRYGEGNLIISGFFFLKFKIPLLLLPSWYYLFRTELVCAGHEVCAEQREADGVATLRRKLQTLLKHLFKCTAVETRGWAASNTDVQQSSSSALFSAYRMLVLYGFVSLTRKLKGLRSPPACPPESRPSLCGKWWCSSFCPVPCDQPNQDWLLKHLCRPAKKWQECKKKKKRATSLNQIKPRG